MPINKAEQQFMSLAVPNEMADMLAGRIARMKADGVKASRSELIRAALTRTNLDRAERDVARAKAKASRS
jgi:Arc/MetJ-type ribon-helix-helix transcriptional regulator